MSAPLATCPLPAKKVIDLYFMEHRAKLIDIAAFLDRIERAPGSAPVSAPGSEGGGGDDFRVAALKRAVGVLIDGKPERAKRILESLSDPTNEPLASAAGMKGASGAWPGAVTARAPSR